MHHTTDKPFILEEEKDRLRPKGKADEFEGDNRKARRKAAAEQRKLERKIKELS